MLTYLSNQTYKLLLNIFHSIYKVLKDLNVFYLYHKSYSQSIIRLCQILHIITKTHHTAIQLKSNYYLTY